MNKKKFNITTLPTSVMMWTINDPVIENHDVLERQFHDIRQAGFSGIAAFVRCSRYTWDQAAAQIALAHAAQLCRQHKMHFWVGPDPRFISRTLIGKEHGVPIICYGDQIKAGNVPNFSPIVQNRFSIRCSIPARPGHMLHEVAIEYTPVGLLKVYACRMNQASYGPRDVIDITPSANFFYNAHDRYVEAFGSFQPSAGQDWHVLAFFLLHSSHFDFSAAKQIHRYLQRLDRFARKIKTADGLLWDEPGYTCQFGALPFSTSLSKEYLRRSGTALKNNIWKMALDCADGSHVRLRNIYFELVQESVSQVQIKALNLVRPTWGDQVLAGMHDTWHFESADMCDMNHGSLDLWQSLRTKSAGFVDLGSVNQLRLPESLYYDNLAAMAIMGRSLARFSKKKSAFNNLWTTGEDDASGWQKSVLAYCVDVMCLFGQRWLAHTYGPAGTIGEEQQFLGSAPLPGYPKHSTWPGFVTWNRQLSEHFTITKGKIPWANILMIFPIETMYSLADFRANKIALEIFSLLRQLLDEHYHVDVISSSLLDDARWTEKGLQIHNLRYEYVLLPYADIISKHTKKILSENPERIRFVFSKPILTKAGQNQAALSMPSLFQWLAQQQHLRPITAPARCWISMIESIDGTMVTLTPSRLGSEYGGKVCCQGQYIELATTARISTIHFPTVGEPQLFSYSG